jgi:glycosyltransferase involved in cell wall biosynthesis
MTDFGRPRILYLVGGPGNAERVDVSDLFARRIAAGGFDIDYVIYTREPAVSWREIEWHGARAFVVGRSARGGFAGAVISKWYELLADLRTFCMALSGRYDIVQVRDKFVVGVLALIATKLRGRVFTYWLSYPFAECRIIDGRDGNARFPRISIAGGHAASWLLYRIILPGADHVFVQSEQMKRDVAAHGIPTYRMTAVPMAVSEKLLDTSKQTIHPGSILYLGTLIRVRRLDTLLEALVIVRRRHPEACLLFVGEGDSPEDRAFLERRTDELGLRSGVRFTGMLPMHEAHALVARSAVCVSPFYPIPILLSTSPTKISEYMALGRPVVANEHPEQSRIIAESGAGYCVEWSAEAFADAIVRLLDDPHAAERMGERGRDYVRRTRIYPVVAPAVLAEYRRLLDHAPATPAPSR